MSKVTLPQEFQDKLNEKAQSVERPTEAKKLFIGIPNMCELSTGLVVKCFAWASQKKYTPWFQFVTEKRHVDHARNMMADLFLASPCEYMVMIDHDVDPHMDLLGLCEFDKDIASASVPCWINGELMPSIWQLSECEQCRVVNVFKEKGTNHDPSQYKISETGNVLYRWNPFLQGWESFYGRSTGFTSGKKCRCQGSGLDPWVFKTHQGMVGTETLAKVDSVGSASMVIARRVFSKLTRPYFTFLYKESREILLTEDHYFCWKAQKEGFEVWANPNMMCSHYKTVDLLQMMYRMCRTFEAGVNHQKQLSAIVAPSAAEIASVLK